MIDEKTYGFNKRDADSLIESIGGKAEVRHRRQPRSPGSSAFIYLTGGSGIGAATGSSTPWTPGSATCTKCEVYDDSGTIKIRTTSPAETDTIYNSTNKTIAASVLIQVKRIGGYLFVDTASCS